MKLKYVRIRSIFFLSILLFSCENINQTAEESIIEKLVPVLKEYNKSEIRLSQIEQTRISLFDFYKERISRKKRMISNYEEIIQLRKKRDSLLKISLSNSSNYAFSNNYIYMDSLKFAITQNLEKKQIELSELDKVRTEKINLIMEATESTSIDSIISMKFEVLISRKSNNPIGHCEIKMTSKSKNILYFKYDSNEKIQRQEIPREPLRE